MNNHDEYSIKIRKISIKNYKGIDELELEFPAPLMPNDPDIFVMGSMNGIGKTSVLECCTFTLAAILKSIMNTQNLSINKTFPNIPYILVRAGEGSLNISSDIEFSANLNPRFFRTDISIETNGTMIIKFDPTNLPDSCTDQLIYDLASDEPIDDLINLISGNTSNPIIENTYLFFHSYRKVQEGESNFTSELSKKTISFSVFKQEIIRLLMDKAQLFESPTKDEYDDDESLKKLHEITKTYASGTIEKLGYVKKNKIELRITPTNGNCSYPFDGLSSGQKEIISTLFMIWYHTRNNPRVVLIDEPELHLNAQWHRSFINTLCKIAPNNQYIIATHSEEIMDSVDANRRILLQTTEAIIK